VFSARSGASVVHVYRLCPKSGRRQTIATLDNGPDRSSRPLIREIGPALVPEDLRYVQAGTLWTLAELHPPHCDTIESRCRLWMEDRGFRDAGVIVLGHSGGAVDVLEFYSVVEISGRLRRECETLAAFGAVAWGRRPAGRVAHWLRATPQITPRVAQPAMEDPLSAANPWKLTAAEVRICALVRAGCDPADIVTRTGNSIATVRTHLRNIYAKAQITGQVALVRLLMADPAPAAGDSPRQSAHVS
jgi:DNA-binding CsgD family transcriptional regulator